MGTSAIDRRTLSRKRSCSRLERSPRQRAVPEGLVAPKEGCPTARIVLHLQVRAVHRIWQNKRLFQQARPLATPSSRCRKDSAISVGVDPELYDPTSYGARC